MYQIRRKGGKQDEGTDFLSGSRGADGDLILAIPRAKRDALGIAVENEILLLTDGWEIKENRYSSLKSERRETLLMQDLPESCYLKVEIQIRDAKQAGVVLQADESMKEGYYLYLEPERGRIVYRSWLRMSENGGNRVCFRLDNQILKIS